MVPLVIICCKRFVESVVWGWWVVCVLVVVVVACRFVDQLLNRAYVFGVVVCVVLQRE